VCPLRQVNYKPCERWVFPACLNRISFRRRIPPACPSRHRPIGQLGCLFFIPIQTAGGGAALLPSFRLCPPLFCHPERSAGLSPGSWGSRRFVPGSPASSSFFCHPDRSGEPALSQVERVATIVRSTINRTTPMAHHLCRRHLTGTGTSGKSDRGNQTRTQPAKEATKTSACDF